jgi:hypothetical protein
MRISQLKRAAWAPPEVLAVRPTRARKSALAIRETPTGDTNPRVSRNGNVGGGALPPSLLPYKAAVHRRLKADPFLRRTAPLTGKKPGYMRRFHWQTLHAQVF